jgi:CzcA family heavy metal efflux pump
MLSALVSLSIRFRGVVIALACLLVGYGIHVTRHAKLDVLPDFFPPQVVVQTESPGLSPEQVEQLVTRPVENAINGAGGIESIRSESIQGLSIITVIFKEGSDIHQARTSLAERLIETSGRLPQGVKAPKMTPLTSATMDLLKIGLLSTNRTPMELRSFADWTVRPRLLAVPGVAKVSVFGGEVRQLQIRLRSDRLAALNVSISDVVQAARSATGIRGAGFVETANQRILLQTEGQSLTPEALGEVIVPVNAGRPIRLADVAEIAEGSEIKFGDALVQGKPGVLLTLSSQYGANTLETTYAIEAALKELEGAMTAQGITIYDRLHRPATFIETALANVRSSLWIGSLCVGVVLFLFLLNVRTAFISLTAIPLSLLTAIILLDRFGVTINTLTLGGLAIALGEVVDDAVIDIENIFRRLRENDQKPVRVARWRVILQASLEVRTAVVYATFVVALVFLPVITLSGLQGKFFAPLGVAYILAILASLLVALTVTPALSAVLFGAGVPVKERHGLLTWIRPVYERLVRLGANAHWLLIGLVVVLCVWAGILTRKFGGEFLPDFREGHLVVQTSTVPGTSLAENLRLGRRISEALLANPNVATVEEQIGRAEAGEDPWGPHRAEFHVELKRGLAAEEEEETQKDIRQMLAGFPGVTSEVLTFLGDRIGETITGETAAVVVSVYGADLDELDHKAQQVFGVLNTISGKADVRLKNPPGAPRYTVRLRPDRLRQYGFSPVEVLDAVETAYQGTVVGQVYENQRVSDVAVILEPRGRVEPETIGALWLQNAQGVRLPLKELATIDLTTGRDSILHDAARRRQTITCNVEGRDVSSFVEEARRKVAAAVSNPRDGYIAFTGVAEQRDVAREELAVHSVAAAVGIVLLLSVVLANWRNLLLVLANLPFAFVGGIVAVYLTNRSLSLGSLVGFVTLFGITTRNSIMLISHFEHLVGEEGAVWNLDTAVRGASERFAPILMTALVTALGLLPLAIGSGQAGREIEGPMAIVILGGLASSTILNLAVLPALAWRFGRFGKNEGTAVL